MIETGPRRDALDCASFRPWPRMQKRSGTACAMPLRFSVLWNPLKSPTEGIGMRLSKRARAVILLNGRPRYVVGSSHGRDRSSPTTRPRPRRQRAQKLISLHYPPEPTSRFGRFIGATSSLVILFIPIKRWYPHSEPFSFASGMNPHANGSAARVASFAPGQKDHSPPAPMAPPPGAMGGPDGRGRTEEVQKRLRKPLPHGKTTHVRAF